ncbi:MAG: exopolyphosphatase, partial [Planctomycetota bacterium]
MNLDPSTSRPDPTSPPEVVAVIDIGASSIRMQIAEISGDGQVRKLESLSQAVSIGRDSFSQGVISKESIEDCVSVLQIYRQRLSEYGITAPRAIRVVGT